jgi:isopenicillin N synthase-like dioxygenase
MTTSDLVPVLDISGDPNAVAADLDVICRDIGFFQIVGHEFDQSVADGAWNSARQFFDLPAGVKEAVAAPYAGYPYGYYGVEGETLTKSLGHDSHPDLKETLSVGPFVPASHRFADDDEASMYVPNLFPDDVMPDMRAQWHAYFDHMAQLSARLMSLFALALALEPTFFDDKIDRHGSSARAVNYPHQDRTPPPGQLRAGAHSDYGTLTVLRQDAAPGGLEVLAMDGSWVPVTSVPDAFVINVGDLLARWTNDRWRSTMHRVVNPPVVPGLDTRRQSFPFFHNANWDCRVDALPTCVPPGQAPKYPSVLAGPHLIEKFRRTVT